MASADAQQQFEFGIWYTISLWPALTVAVQNNWGGPDSASKRDWFAGAISELFDSRPDTDQIDVESVLLQVMQDEFDVNVEDETEVPVAEEIMKIRKQVFEDGDFSGVEAVKARWTARGGKMAQVNVVSQTIGEDGEEIDDDSDDDEDEDVDMGDAPALVPREKPEPEVDDDGFTKVVGKKRR
ncbi:Pre-rRNA-processing protein TSR2-domain-containing protein [Delphinella strobiligena]|nr:Pre-rRNA-processing protein TSR2-domain-containing protein [Delphinella strobiligena]